MIETTLVKGTTSQPDLLLLKVILDDNLYVALMRGEMSGIGDKIVEKIAEHILPEMEQRVLSDPTFKDRVIGDILIRIANRLADKGFLEKKQNDGKV
ncbi:MAG: hypothetical protein V4438_04415 [Patescibacteria group bacterium]